MDEEKNIAERIKDAFSKNLGYIAVVLVSVAYVATSFLTVANTGKSPWQIIYDGVLAFVVGVLMNRMFETQGMINGDADHRVITAVDKHADMVEVVSPLLDELDEWCDEKNAQALARSRRIYLSRYGMRYHDYFSEDGTPLPFVPVAYNKLKDKFKEFDRKRRFKHALKIKITRLTSSLLISDTGNPNDPYYLGRSKKEYETQSAKQDVRVKAIFAFIFGYYGIQLLANFSWANLLWTALQLAFFLLMGALKMEQATIYVVDEYRSRITKKTSILTMFVASRKEGEEDGEIR